MFERFLEKNPKLTWLLIISYMSFIFYLSSLPSPPQPIEGYEKEAPIVEHIIEFSLLGFLLVPGFKNLRVRKFLFLAIVVGIFYGITDEAHQFFVPGRYSTFLDVLADSVGVFLGTYLAYLKS